MRIITQTIHYNHHKKSTSFTIVPIGDVHLGNVGCDKRKLLDTVKFIKETPNCYWIGMGDMAECITPTDKRFDPQSIDPTYNIRALSQLINCQIESIVSIFTPIKISY